LTVGIKFWGDKSLAETNPSEFINGWFSMFFRLKKTLFYRPELIYIFGLALVVRLIYLIFSISQIGVQGIASASPDGLLYVNMAKDLLTGANSYDYGFFTFGPGFAYYLAFNMIIFGQNNLPIILLHIFISSFSCLLIYKLANLITQSRPVSVMAGILLALSYTAITLSIVILSDTLYFFLFLIGLILFLNGMERGHWKYFISAGVFSGLAILTRSIGQFWPIMLFIIALPYIFRGRSEENRNSSSKKGLLLKVTVASLIAIMLMSVWIVRNYKTYGIPTLALTSAGGGANVAAFTLEKIEGKPAAQIKQSWTDEYVSSNNLKSLKPADNFRLNFAKARQTFFEHPWAMLKTFLTIAWENLNAFSFYHRVLLPDYKAWAIPLEYKIENMGLNHISFYLSMLGLAILIITRQYRGAIILASVYFYYAGMIGFYRWQGSRLFFPGQIADLILISIVSIYTFGRIAKIGKLIRKLGKPFMNRFPRLKPGFFWLAPIASRLLQLLAELS
jgi:4-amino-4-deoxy-L-arabinose transferase-like glycosyltransferase